MAEIILPTRRKFITGLTSLLAAPAVVRVDSLMKIRGVPIQTVVFRWTDYEELAKVTRQAFLPRLYASYHWGFDG